MRLFRILDYKRPRLAKGYIYTLRVPFSSYYSHITSCSHRIFQQLWNNSNNQIHQHPLPRHPNPWRPLRSLASNVGEASDMAKSSIPSPGTDWRQYSELADMRLMLLACFPHHITVTINADLPYRTASRPAAVSPALREV